MRLDGSDHRALLERLLRRGVAHLPLADQELVQAELWRALEAEDRREERTAIHEAGHAVVAHGQGMPLEWIRMDDVFGEGTTHIDRERWFGTTLSLRERTVEWARVMVAGYVAERMAFGSALPAEAVLVADLVKDPMFGLGVDEAEAFVWAVELEANAILDTAWNTVERVAAALLAERRLKGERLAALLTSPGNQ